MLNIFAPILYENIHPDQGPVPTRANRDPQSHGNSHTMPPLALMNQDRTKQGNLFITIHTIYPSIPRTN